MKRQYQDYLQDILDAAEDVRRFMGDMSEEEFSRDRKTQFAVIRAIEVIGEAAKNIPKSVRGKYPSCPWKEMAGMRDKLIHQYFGVDVRVLWKTAKEDLPQIKGGMKVIFREK